MSGPGLPGGPEIQRARSRPGVHKQRRMFCHIVFHLLNGVFVSGFKRNLSLLDIFSHFPGVLKQMAVDACELHPTHHCSETVLVGSAT